MQTGISFIPAPIAIPDEWGMSYENGKLSYWEKISQDTSKEIVERTISLAGMMGKLVKLEGDYLKFECEVDGIRATGMILLELIGRASVSHLISLPKAGEMMGTVLQCLAAPEVAQEIPTTVETSSPYTKNRSTGKTRGKARKVSPG